jgi:lipoic acid synthetase
MNKKPKWLRATPYSVNKGMEVSKLLKKLNLNTVCSEARCPNIGECFDRRTATFMILGRVCSRNCKFCNVSKGKCEEVNKDEPLMILRAVKELNLKHVVITSVTRDDLEDGGSKHFYNVVKCIKNNIKNITTEVLIPDFKGDIKLLKNVINAKPDIISHNIETVPRLYKEVRAMVSYQQSLDVLKNIKKYSNNIYNKTGIMIGLGEKKEEIIEVMHDLKEVSCDVLTIGQYLAPSKEHYPVKEYIEPLIFENLKEIGIKLGFKHIESGPLVRSSYMADKAINKID